MILGIPQPCDVPEPSAALGIAHREQNLLDESGLVQPALGSVEEQRNPFKGNWEAQKHEALYKPKTPRNVLA